MARRFMTEDEVQAAVREADGEEYRLAHAYAAATNRARDARDERDDEVKRQRRRKSDTGRGLGELEVERLSKVADELYSAEQVARDAYMLAKERAEALREHVGERAREVFAELNLPRKLAALAAPCRMSSGLHAMRTGKTWGGGASGMLLHCQHCEAAVVLSESQAVAALLDHLAKTGALAELPPVVGTIED